VAELPKNYDPKAVESRLYKRWEEAGYFHEEPDPSRPPFIICMPPPNVTAGAHLGHGSTYTPMDVLTRYHRMLGENADWLPGTDHAAIATEAVLVRQLASSGKSRESLGREKYLEIAWEWSRQTGGTIFEQFRRLGFGPDWQRSRFTMDETLSAAVRKVFVVLYRDGLIYRGKRLINWDPKARSTISDAEVEHEERDGTLWRIRYPFDSAEGPSIPQDDKAGIEIATTRPETMLGDVAIAVNPKDKRYAGLVGKSVLVPPLLERAIPIVADESVDPEFGTGAVKVTPAHDATDYEIGLRHNLPMPSVLDLDARISGADVAVGRYEGMSRDDARAAIVADLRAQKLLIEEKPYRYAIAISDRTGEVVEPLLSLQWFVKMKPLAEPALQAYRDGRVRFIPERYGRTFEQWLENIRDWNISRQIWWGHQLPVWYTPDGSVVVAETEEEARELAQTPELTRDPDTLDTWFSSGLWPFSILGWPNKTPELEHWYPSQVLVTGWEIIFLWVARMVMLGLKFMDQVPFKDVFIAPLVFDAQGRKMSKSLGNVIDPLDLIERYGADAFRMGMMRQLRLESQEVRFNERRCEEARNFNNKIWNALRYILSLPEELPPAMQLAPAGRLTIADKWILTRLHATAAEVSAALDRYDFGIAAETIWAFVWYELCDWYLEATKDAHARETRAAVLSFVLNHAVRLLHPIAPFITEEVWLALPHDGETIVTASWPDLAEIPTDPQSAEAFEALRRKVEQVRNLRAELALAPRERVTVEVPANVPPGVASLLGTLAVADIISAPEKGASLAEALAAVETLAPRGILIERYKKEAARLRSEIERSEGKLADQRFVANAKPEVVTKEREKLAGYQRDLERVLTMQTEMGATQ
jgi:valyl-tRNA synthetase